MEQGEGDVFASFYEDATGEKERGTHGQKLDRKRVLQGTM